MPKIERFEDLMCWQEARDLAREIYDLCGTGPLSRDFRIRDQLTGAAVSVMSNIAEGFARHHRGDFIRFLDIAQSSAVEVKSLLYVVLDQGYAPAERVQQLQVQAETSKALTLGLLRHVDRSRNTPSGTAREPTATYGDLTNMHSWNRHERFVAMSSFSKPSST
jgi:four helix bundle protein